MGLKELEIKLCSPWGGYYAGQLISGTLECAFDTPKSMRGIYIKLKGRAETCWRESRTIRRNGKSETVTETFSGSEEYFNANFYLLGGIQGDEIEMPAGTYSYPFQYTLPSRLPSSFEGEHGNIRYTVKATIDRPWKFDHEAKLAFTVVSHMDLNNFPEAKLPLVINMHKRFCCCCCKSAPLSVDVGIPVSGYCSGETIPVEVSLENGSNVEICETTIKLIKVVTYHSYTPRQSSNSSKVTISKVKADGVLAHSTNHFIKSLEIPPLPPSNLVNCNIIDLSYQILISCEAKGCHSNLDRASTILIGTVPIGYKQENTSVPAADAPLLLSSITTSQPQHMQMPPPIVNPYPSNPSFPPYPSNTSQNAYPQPFVGPHPYPYPPGQNPSYPTGYSAAPYPPASNTDQKVPYPSESTTTSNPPYSPSDNPPYNPQMPQLGEHPPSAPSAPQIGNETDSKSINPTVNPMCPYPTAQPIFRESQFSASTIHEDGDNQHTRIIGGAQFAPRYPTYGFFPN